MVSGTIIHHQTLATLLAEAGVSLTTLAGLDPARRNEAARSTIYVVLTCGGMLCSFPNEMASYAAWRNSGAARVSRAAAAAWDVSLQEMTEKGKPMASLPIAAYR